MAEFGRKATAPQGFIDFVRHCNNACHGFGPSRESTICDSRRDRRVRLFTRGDRTIRRPMKSTQAPQKEGPRTNREIRAREVQLIDAEGHNRGVVQIQEAQQAADEASLDLVEIVPTAEPPVCKILDYGKFRFLEQKKAAEARKKQKIVEIKEIKLRPGIDEHDYDTKMKAVRRFFEEGDKVKVTLRFRGREMAHQDIGYKLLERVKAETGTYAKVEIEPSMEGRQMVMILAPR
jgi:translation initiation factor IF-3